MNFSGRRVVKNTTTRSSDKAHLLVLGMFLISGFLSGLMFGWLISTPELQSFFYIKGDKFLIPRYTYWFAFSLTQLLGLVAGFSVSRWRKWLAPIRSIRRLAVAALVIGLATPFLQVISPLMGDIRVALIGFFVLVSFAMCVLTGSVRLLPIATIWNLIFAAAGFVIIYGSARVFNAPNTWYELLQWPILESMLSLSIASWIVWRQRSDVTGAPSIDSSLQSAAGSRGARLSSRPRW